MRVLSAVFAANVNHGTHPGMQSIDRQKRSFHIKCKSWSAQITKAEPGIDWVEINVEVHSHSGANATLGRTGLLVIKRKLTSRCLSYDSAISRPPYEIRYTSNLELIL